MAVVHTDAFTVGSDTNLDAYGDWVELGTAGDMLIVAADDDVEPRTGDTNLLSRWTGAADIGDQEAEADVTFDTSGFHYGGPAVRVDSNSDGYVAILARSEQEIQLYRADAGSYTEIASAAVTVNNATAYNVRIRAEGTTLTVWVDDNQLIQTTDATHSTGNGGLFFFNSGGSFVINLDNFVLDDLTSAASQIEANLTTGSEIDGISSVEFFPEVDLLAGSVVDGTATTQEGGDQSISANLLSNFDLIDGETLNVYIDGFSDMLAGATVGGEAGSAAVTNITSSLEVGATLDDERVELTERYTAELTTGFEAAVDEITFSLEATLTSGFRVQGATQLGARGEGVLRKGNEFLDGSREIVKNPSNKIVKDYGN